MRNLFWATLGAACFALPGLAHASGGVTCNAGPQSGWQPQDALRQRLTAQGWQIRQIKIDGGCYEVYAIDERGQRVEVYFHPVTLARVTAGQR